MLAISFYLFMYFFYYKRKIYLAVDFGYIYSGARFVSKLE